MHQVTALTLLTALWTLTPEQTAEPSAEAPFLLSWTAPPDCAERPVVSELVGDAPGAAAVVIASRGARWHVAITFSAPVQGLRTLEAGTCEEAVEAVRLLLRLGARGFLPPEAAEAAPEPPSSEPPLPAEATPSSVDSAPSLSISLAAVVGMRALVLPRVSPRFGALMWLELGPWNILAELGTGLPERFSGGPSADSAVEIHPLLEGLVGCCVSHQWPAARLAGCLEVEASWWQLRGLNVSAPKSGSSALVALGPSVRALFPLAEKWIIHVGGAFRPMLARPQASFEGYGTALEAGAFLASFEMGLGARW